MTTKPTETLQRWCHAALLALVAALAACGPGTGGTGTGPIQGVSAYSGGAGPAILPTPADTVNLRLEPERVELAAGCKRFLFSGPWEVSAGGEALLNGTLETTTAGGTGSTPATLRLQFSDGTTTSPRVTAVVMGESGGPLLGPVTLERSEAAAFAPAQCVPP